MTSTSSTQGGGVSSLGGGALQITGLASGLDTNSIITQLMALRSRPVTTLQTQESQIKARDAQLTTIQTALKTLGADALALEDPMLLRTSQAVTSSDATRVSATSTTGAGVGGYQVSVTQLANSAQRTFSFTSPTSDDTITIDGHATTIAAGASIADVVASINGDSDATVYAAATSSGTIVFSNRKTGDTGSDFIQVADSGGALVEQTARAKQGRDAQYEVDGVAGSSHSNTVTDAIAGVTLSLNGLTSTGPVTLNVAAPTPNADKLETALKKFVTDYNSTLSTIQTQLTTRPSGTDGTLYQDPGLSDLLSSMRTLMYRSGPGLPTGLSSMLDLGVSTGTASGSATPSGSAIAGDLAFDPDKLEAQLKANPSGVQKVLIGFAGQMGRALSAQASVGGTIANRITSDNRSISNLDDRITGMQKSLAQQQAQLTQQFAQLEAVLSQNQSQASWLASQIAALPGVNTNS